MPSDLFHLLMSLFFRPPGLGDLLGPLPKWAQVVLVFGLIFPLCCLIYAASWTWLYRVSGF